MDAAAGQRPISPAALAARMRIRPAILVVLATLFAAATTAFFTLFMIKKGIIPDFYWILRSGQYVLDQGRLPTTDLFSWSMADKPVLLYQWLFMTLTAAGERVLGMHGLLLLFAALCIGVYLVIPLLGAVPRRVPAGFVILIGGVGLAIITVNMALRPMIATSALLLAQYMIIQTWRRDRLRLRQAAVLTAGVYLLWTNLHNGVALGFASLLFFALGDLAERRRFYPFDPADPEIEGKPQPLRPYMLLAVLAGLASLVNPYGLGSLAHLADYSSTKYLVDIINETQSPDFHFPQFVMFLVVVAGIFAAMPRATRSIAAADLLHLAVFTAATFSIQRMVVWSVLFFVLILPRTLHHCLTASASNDRGVAAGVRAASIATRRAAVVVSAGVVIAFALWQLTALPLLGDRCEEVREAIKVYGGQQRPTDRLFTTALAGSCALALESPPLVFFDSRFDFYGEAFSKQAIDAEALLPGWREFLDKWRIDTAIVERGQPLAQALAVDPAFTILYQDDTAVVVRRRTAVSGS